MISLNTFNSLSGDEKAFVLYSLNTYHKTPFEVTEQLFLYFEKDFLKDFLLYIVKPELLSEGEGIFNAVCNKLGFEDICFEIKSEEPKQIAAPPVETAKLEENVAIQNP